MRRLSADRIKEVIESLGVDYVEKENTFYAPCPTCGKSDKCSISKRGGATICYRASCGFGRQWFQDWVAGTAKVSKAKAAEMVDDAGKVEVKTDSIPPFVLEDKYTVRKDEGPAKIAEVEWPPFGVFPIDFAECLPGRQYLESRGIPLDVAVHYQIRYNMGSQRVVFPVFMDGKCYGWQARAIRPTHKSMRMLNNKGTGRQAAVMFYDRLKGSDHAIVCEGPVDAMKFHLAGGNVATMGAIVTDSQMDAILKSGIKKLYVALDDDAFMQVKQMIERSPVPVFRPLVPESCKERCKAAGKKADFGECTFEECLEAFRSAPKADSMIFIGELK